MTARPPRLFTIPASAPFLPVLADALLDGGLIEGFTPRGDPFALATTTIFLPTRRAGRLLAEALRARVEVAGMPAGVALLPRIVPLGDVDEDALAFAESFADPPRAVKPTTRRLALASLVKAWRSRLRDGDGRVAVAAGPGAEIGLADALAHLIDEMAAQEVPWERLDALVPGEHDAYWDMALDFLKIARDFWPAHLAEHGEVDASIRRDRLIAAEAERLLKDGATGPVIAAGSTGSLPATARLLAAVAHLPRGCVVLPGLDTDLDEASWQALTDEAAPAPSHPQYGLALLLSRHLRAARAQVAVLAPPAVHGRERLLSEALRPVATTEAWASLEERLGAPAIDAALAGVALIEAEDSREEALAIAVALREVLEDPTRTAALITPDRDLARRVAAELLRFDIAIDDSAGEPLSESAPGRFARLVADACVDELAPLPLAALLRHALARFGLERAELAPAVEALEMMVLRGPRPAPGAPGLVAAVAAFSPAQHHPSDPRARIGDAPRARAADLAARVAGALGPLLTLGTGVHAFAALVDAHRRAIAGAWSERDDGVPQDGAPQDETALAVLAQAFDDLAEAARDAPAMTLGDYASALVLLLGDRPVRPPLVPGARLRILGPLEARLVSVDRVVLAGLVEQGWPAAVRTDPWLSRPMRAALGLEAPERRIGLSAHDFAQGGGAPELVLSHARKLGGAPTVPSRFLQRLAAVSGKTRWEAALARGDRLRRLAARIDAEPKAPRLPRPEPAPPLDLRPKRLSVTEIETWLRDPYTIYARHVLKLAPLDALDEAPGAGERGSAIHAALGTFALAFPEGLPADPEAALLAHGRRAFAPLEAFPAAHALWWARFERLVPRVIAWEQARRPGTRRIFAEVYGRLELPGGRFTLTGRADRIEQRRDGGLAIVDFKTGAVPTARQTKVHYSPQLPLEAAMAASGSFREVPAEEAAALIYVKLATAGLKETSAVDENDTAAGSAMATLERLGQLVAAFENPSRGYASLARPMFRGRFGDFDHLARVKEWATSGEGEE
ncbi:double-strand break repair protein AddB [Ancylobacter amanitiformis]|uniref:ATP-dependent helicase/nuclease subunit B n=1 Tax=Ancylobacter amanitiformis TaxID=217069 RepID=A0ABU0LUQ2_9HYPH|nr:double-strand break repair protein AddB [Ancylobacter amanitiformis]MDQ0512402.1 ATP-dependent helicase/nuclease subunit B [Ancylobacter amanitiformis]